MLRTMPEAELIAFYLKAEQRYVNAMFVDDDTLAVMAYAECVKYIREVMYERNISVPV